MYKCLAAISYGALTVQSLQLYPDSIEEQVSLFDDFKSTYNIHYPSEQEDKYRLSVFLSNLKTADRLNAIGGATFGVTEHSGMTEEEFVKSFLGVDPSATAATAHKKEKKNSVQNSRVTKYQPDEAVGVELAATYNKDWSNVRTTAVKNMNATTSCSGTWG